MTTFHQFLAAKAKRKAAMLAEPLLGLPMGPDAMTILASNMANGHMEECMDVADALVRDLDPQREILRGYSYDEVMRESAPGDVMRSGRRAAGSIKEFAVVEGKAEETLKAAIAAELTYLWLRSCEPAYDRFAQAGR